MAPLGQAKRTTYIETREDGTKVYSAKMDPEWTIMAYVVSYTMSLVLNAAIQHQRNTSHDDVIYITSFFVKALTISAERTELHVKPVRPGKSAGRFTNLKVDLFQDDVPKVTANLVFGRISTESGPNLPESHQPICPLKLHPGTVDRFSKKFPQQKFAKHFEWAADRSVSKDTKDILFGSWTEFADRSGSETMEADTLAMFLDITTSPFTVVGAPDPEYAGVDMWYPTVVMTLEFKVKLPLLSDSFAPTTLGVFSRKSHVRNGRYTDVAELWTAPCSIGDKEHVVDENWREKMVCVAVGGQMGLMVPATLNNRHRSPVQPKL
ncbi:hypothetical protein FRB94_007173 [Tulasnella sp. JGI-2019a]|nr:hypothetical protein FRB94_007173 [Tulasnella sp. JGI-2019a]